MSIYHAISETSRLPYGQCDPGSLKGSSVDKVTCSAAAYVNSGRRRFVTKIIRTLKSILLRRTLQYPASLPKPFVHRESVLYIVRGWSNSIPPYIDRLYCMALEPTQAEANRSERRRNTLESVSEIILMPYKARLISKGSQIESRSISVRSHN